MFEVVAIDIVCRNTFSSNAAFKDFFARTYRLMDIPILITLFQQGNLAKQPDHHPQTDFTLRSIMFMDIGEKEVMPKDLN